MVKNNRATIIVEARRSERTDVDLPAAVDAGPAHNIRVIVRNISAHGVMIEVSARLAPGRPLEIDLPRLGKRAAHIAWIRDGRAGVAFDAPLTPDELAGLV